MHDLVIDNFAGGGGASTGIEKALGRAVDIAINHDPHAIAMHKANHPGTFHYCCDVFEVDPVAATQGRRVLLGWFSPDCKHYSKARGGKPVNKNIRSLAWVVLRWASKVRPRVIMLENVEEFQDWGPLVRKREHGRPVLDDAGNPVLVPDPKRKKQTFMQWCDNLRALGYALEHRELRACDYGAPTIRKRLFVIARCDGLPIVWPEPTHGTGLQPYRTAAECIDWSIACPSIFLTKEQGRAIGVKRPLVDNTLRRIAVGVQRYVIDAAEPFIVPVTHAGDDRTHGVYEPLRTITTAQRGEFALVAPHVMTMRNAMKPHTACNEPTHTITAGGAHQNLVAAFLAQHNTGVVGHPAGKPLSTITMRGTQQQLVTSHLLKLKGTCRHGSPMTAPAPTVQANGLHLAEVRAFLIKYYTGGSGKTGWALNRSAPTITATDRLGLVTVQGVDYQIVDIGMRMLVPRELFRAQGFPDDYIIDRGPNGEPLTKTLQVKMCGNSVPPAFSEALVRANVVEQSGVQHAQA